VQAPVAPVVMVVRELLVTGSAAALIRGPMEALALLDDLANPDLTALTVKSLITGAPWTTEFQRPRARRAKGIDRPTENHAPILL
jgi:hypothetical protein